MSRNLRIPTSSSRHLSARALLVGGTLAVSCRSGEPRRSTATTLPGSTPHGALVGQRDARPFAGLPEETSSLGAEAMLGESAAFDPTPPTGDLLSEMESFTTMASCVEARARLDPVVAEALDALGYDTIVRDGCQTLAATKAGSTAQCRTIEASPVELACESTVAQVSGDADACPWEVAAIPELGRDPACLAVSTLDPRLCSAVLEPRRRAECRAKVFGNSVACEAIGQPSDRHRCEREAQRWRSLIARRKTDQPPAEQRGLPVASGTLAASLVRPGEDGGGETLTLDLKRDVERGVVLRLGRDGVRFSLGTMTAGEVDPIAASPHVLGSLGLALASVSEAGVTRRGEAPQRIQIDRAELVLPGHSRVESPPSTSSMQVYDAHLGASRGGAVQLTVEGEVREGERRWRIHAQITTFIRDVVGPEARTANSPNPNGSGTELRSPVGALRH